MSEELGNTAEPTDTVATSNTDTTAVNDVEASTQEKVVLGQQSVEAGAKTEETVEDTGTETDAFEYEFGSDFKFSDEEKKQANDFMKQVGVSNNEQADLLISFLKETEKNRVESEQGQMDSMFESWDKALDEDKNFSKNRDENLKIANKALEQYGGKEMTEWLVKTGFNRHPEMIKMFHRIGKDLEDAKVLTGVSGKQQVKRHDKFGNPTFNLTQSLGDK